MKELKEVQEFLNGKTKEELALSVVKRAGELAFEKKEYADTFMKAEIRRIEDLLELYKWAFRNKLPGMMKGEGKEEGGKDRLSVKEASEMLGVSEPTIRNYVKAKLLSPLYMGEEGRRKILRFERSEIEAFGKKRKGF